MKIKDTIIIGAGAAGLGCAHTLLKNGRSFKVITENIGGRLHTTKNGSANLGAIIVTDDYEHILPFVTKESRIKTSECAIHKGKQTYNFFSPRNVSYIPSYIKLRRELSTFRKAYSLFRKRAEHMSQKEAMEADSYLLGLFHQHASGFIKEKGIESFCHKFLCEGIYAFTFTDVHKINAFAYLHFLQFVVVPFYIFRVDKKKLFDPVKPHTVIDSVVSVKNVGDVYAVKTKKAMYRAKHVVVATPVNISKKLLRFRRSKMAVKAYVFHVQGVPKPRFDHQSNAFFAPAELYATLQQADGTHVVYSRIKKPDLSKYFSDWEILDSVYWPEAEFMVGTELIEANREDNLFVIGDYNIAGLEDSFVTGIYAANQIIANTK